MRHWTALRFVAAFVAGLLTGPLAAQAGTITGGVCMQSTYGGPILTNSNRLNCTANDIAIARAISASPDTCILGQFFT